MSTKKEIWRLLEPGVDVWQEGDERLGPFDWHATSYVGGLVDEGETGRRRMTLPEPQGWISVKERMPTREESLDESVLWCVLRHNDLGAAWTDEWNGPEFPDVTHWMPIPQLPEDPTKDPDEEAWMEHLQRFPNTKNMKWLFMAGRKSVATDGGSHE